MHSETYRIRIFSNLVYLQIGSEITRIINFCHLLQISNNNKKIEMFDVSQLSKQINDRMFIIKTAFFAAQSEIIFLLCYVISITKNQ